VLRRASTISLGEQSPRSAHVWIVLDAGGYNPKPLRRLGFGWVFLLAVVVVCTDGMVRLPSPSPALALLASLFHRRFKTIDSKSVFHALNETSNPNEPAARMPRHPAGRPAGFRWTPRPFDPRGSRRHGGSSETRPRVKPARARRPLAPDFECGSFLPPSKGKSFRLRFCPWRPS
jgi:hypothetical protein